MTITTNDDWQWVNGGYETAFATTSDPRVVAVIQREEDYGGGHIDGDVYAPAWYFDTWREELDDAGSTFRDDASEHIMSRLADARWRFRHARMPFEVVERWLRIFHDSTMRQVKSSIDQETQVVILNTPTWRERTGATVPEDGDILDGDVADWQAAMDGDVYGIGFATSDGRVLDDDEIDLDDPAWVTEIESYGYLGEDYAKESAARFDTGEPMLEPMLELPAGLNEPGFIEHTDRMANSAADGWGKN